MLVSYWLMANKLSLNVTKSNFVIFRLYQKRVNNEVDVKIFDYSTNIIEGKITECWLVSEEGIFFLILLCEEDKITRSRLVLRLASNSSFNREVVFL